MRKLKQLLLFLSLFVGILLFFQNCQKEIVGVDNQTDKKYHIEKKTAHDLSDVVSFLHHNNPKLLGKDNLSLLNLDTIMEVTEANGMINYTFQINNIPRYDSIIHVSNLIVKKDTLGDFINPYVIDYEIEPQFYIDYLTHQKDLYQYEGSISTFTLNDFLYNVDIFLDSEKGPPSDNDLLSPCSHFTMFYNPADFSDAGGSYGNGGIGDVTEDNPDYSGEEGEGVIIIDDSSNTGGGNSGGGGGDDDDDEDDFVIVSPRFFLIYPSLFISPNKSNSLINNSSSSHLFLNSSNPKTGDPCEQIIGGVYGMFFLNQASLLPILNSYIGIDDTDTDIRNWVIDIDNRYYVFSVVNYIVNNLGDSSSILFAEEAFYALMDGGKVDFIENVILDPTITNNQKVNCVFEKLKLQNNTLFETMINDFFGNSDHGDIKFEIGNIPTGEDALTYTAYDVTDTISYPGKIMKIRFGTNFVNNASSLEVALAFIHETIHAELIRRCIEDGIIKTIAPNGNVTFFDNSTSSVSEEFFITIANYYINFQGNESQWNHNLFTFFNYQDKMIQNLIDIHPILNDPNNDFLTNINSDPNIVNGPYTLTEVMEYVSWIGLESTAQYQMLINSNPSYDNNKLYIEYCAKNKYTQSCN